MRSVICRIRGHKWELLKDVEATSIGGVHQECRRCGKQRLTYRVKDREAGATHVINDHMWPT
ncbi:MAG: hypothetical protein H0U62_05120 [Actinobacteria bacterium]|nr:hypothetical protein [Actinomycetota bacterium]